MQGRFGIFSRTGWLAGWMMVAASFFIYFLITEFFNIGGSLIFDFD